MGNIADDEGLIKETKKEEPITRNRKLQAR